MGSESIEIQSPRAVLDKLGSEGLSFLPEKHQGQIEDFLDVHDELFGVGDMISHTKEPFWAPESSRKYPYLYQYGPRGLVTGEPIEDKTIQRYLQLRSRALFLAAKISRKKSNGEEYKRLMAERKDNGSAFKAARVKPGQKTNEHRLHKLLAIFQGIEVQAGKTRRKQTKLTPLNLFAHLMPLLHHSLAERMRRADVAVISHERAREVLYFVERRYAPSDARTVPDHEKTYKVFRVRRKKLRPVGHSAS